MLGIFNYTQQLSLHVFQLPAVQPTTPRRTTSFVLLQQDHLLRRRSLKICVDFSQNKGPWLDYQNLWINYWTN